jgi:peptidyl-prolyl cis-trans isomerase A (cyclophilin A)
MAMALALALSSCSREEAREEVPAPGRDPKPVRVLFQTELGDIEIEVDTGRAPVTAGNFLKYVDAGRYNGGRFHRTVKLDNQPDSAVKIEVIQGGINPAEEGQKLPSIPLERTNRTGILHKDGAISMARAAPDSATSDFFLCIGDQPALDFGGQRNPDGQGFAAFGRVVKGMDAVKKVQQAKSEGQTLTPPIGILKAARL